MAWTEERIEQLKKLWEAGDTASQIAEKLGDVSRNAVIGKAHRLGLQARPSPVKNSDHAEAADHGHKEKEEATPSVSKNPTVAPVVNEARKELHKKETVKSVKAVEAVAPPPVAEKKPEPAPVIRSIGPGGFQRQVPGEQTAPIPPAPPRRLVPAKPSPEIADKTSLLDLTDRICRWPMGHPGEPDFHFCGKPVNPGFPYCLEHCSVAYQAQLPRRDRRPTPTIPFPQNRS
ncbi:GcrA family cell cycle regulator [Zymomonas sp.]|uniref:GcrA family cell cycle regulator n=1 Tax=Zymomonas sp. TaxID=2068624 RepID=UPI0025D2C9D8|nr:GcrA family cell cycle regulator [Zymomonas sp.]MCA1955250.1 GcrA cell cycle regulator [Zymomonas sp.]